MQIAIDGFAASGKSTAARLLAELLGFVYIDTGAMYRAVTLSGIKRGISFEDEDEIIAIARSMKLEIKQNPGTYRGYRIILDGADVTERLFMPDVDKYVSIVAKVGHVRSKLVEMQREMAEKADVVMAGRDICSNVLKNADLKIFLTASQEIRALRRQKEMEEKGEKKEFNQILENIKLRDRIDTTRKDNPLVKTPDAVEIDCSHLSITQMVDRMEEMVKNIQMAGNSAAGK